MARRWTVAAKAIAARAGSELRELQYQLSTISHAVPAAAAPVTATSVYRDLLALEQEFGEVEVADDLSVVSVVTGPILLEGIALGRFQIAVDLSRPSRGRFDTDAVSAEALDPNPAACNEEVTHPHVQAGCICFGDGSLPVRAALAEGRLYDLFVITRSVLQAYNEASPYVSLAHWSGRRCDQCDDLVSEDELYGCQGCGSSMCSGCEHTCPDCESSYCRSCLKEDDRDLVCSDCRDRREERRAEEEDEQDEDDMEDDVPIHPLPETLHAQANP